MGQEVNELQHSFLPLIYHRVAESCLLSFRASARPACEIASRLSQDLQTHSPPLPLAR